LSGLLFGIAVALAVWSRIPARYFLLFFIAPAWASLLVFIGFSVGFGVTPVFSLGPLTLYREGMFQGMFATARVLSDMAWMAVVFLTTPIDRALLALKWFRVPAILVETIGMTYRYAFLLVDEFNRMRQAGRMRGGFRSYRHAQQSSAMILAQVILRAYDRAGRIQEAMTARGAAASTSSDSARKKETVFCPNRCDITPSYGEGDEDGPVLSCCNLAYGYSGKPVIKDITLEVTKGEVVVLCGPNGAGKSTLLKLLSGGLVPSAGEVFLCGRRLDRKARNDAFRHVGILTQDPNDQLFCTHVRDDIAFGPMNLGLEPEEVDRLVDIAMELMEVKHLADRPIHKLSYGEMRRVGLAGIIAMEPPLILLDEPTANLDPASTNHLLSLIHHLNHHHGYTFVIVTHDIDVASSIAQRIIILDGGEVKADGTARKILTDEKLLLGSRLEPPILTKLFQRIQGDLFLDSRGIPITIEEAASLLCSRKEFACKLHK
jgi:cobalt/nickel transport system ATP-binding protein